MLKKIKTYTLIAFVIGALLFTACSGNDPAPWFPAKINLHFTQYNQGIPQQYDTMKYLNAAGNHYLVNEIQYFVSDVTLHFNDGTRQLLDGWKDIHYVDTDLPETHNWQVYDDIQTGQVEQVSFTFGISEEKNQSLMFLNPPERDMFWPEYLGGGYHYMKLNGKWLAGDGVIKPFDFHLGIGQIYAGGVIHVDSIAEYIQNYFEVNLSSSSFAVAEGDTLDFEIRMNVENWFKNPNSYNHDEWGGDIMQQQAAMQLGCENGREDVFRFCQDSGEMKTINLHSAKHLAHSGQAKTRGNIGIFLSDFFSFLNAIRNTHSAKCKARSAKSKNPGIKGITSFVLFNALNAKQHALRAMQLFTSNPFIPKHPTQPPSYAMRYALCALHCALSTMLLTLASCSSDAPTPEPFQPTPYEIDIPYGFPTILNIPDNNPMTVEGVRLGRTLFYDGRLSGRTHPDSLMSCSTCHLQENSFECGTDHPEYVNGFTHGITGKPTPHVMLPLINLVWNSNGYLWNGMVSPENPAMIYGNLEDLVWMGVTAEHEMNSDTTRVKELYQNIPGYPEMFEKAFGTKTVTMDRISKAIAQFVRTLISSNAKFDRYMRGEVQLSPEELRGFVLFTTEEGADCFHCHGGFGNPLFTTNKFYNNGKDSVFNDPRDRYAITGDPMDKGAYKATTLRNIELTGPYMHDGRFATLEEVIEFYSHDLVNSPQIDPLMHHIANGGNQLTPSEKSDLMAFIKTLRDDEFLTNPDFGPPESLPGK